MPETNLDKARLVAERVRRAVAEVSVASPDGATVSVTCSIGVTTMALDEVELDTALARADGALYAAKRSGRDRVEVEPHASHLPHGGATGES